MNIDPITGLPKELGAFHEISKEDEAVEVTTTKKKFGKKYTVISGLGASVDGKSIAKSLKSKFACGGTFKDGKIELQGDYTSKIVDVLVGLGFDADNINVTKGR